MPTARNTGHRLMAGTAANAAAVTTSFVIQTTDGSGWASTYGIATDTRSPIGSTKPVLIPWLAPIASPASVPLLSQYTTNLDGTVRGDGFYSLTWTFAYWTFGMYAVFLANYAASGELSMAVSLMTYDASNTAVYLTATLDTPRPGTHMETEVAGWKNIQFNFHHGTIIT